MIINDLPLIMIRCLVITIFIEMFISYIFKVRNIKDFINILLVNIITNPMVVTIPVYINIKYGLFERNIILFLLEILTILVEGFVYKKYLDYRKISPFVLSIILNFSSYFLGEIINYMF